MAVITISREFGSFGTMISRQAAKDLDYYYIDKKVMETVLQQYGLVTFHEFYDTPHTFWQRLADGNSDIIGVFNNTVREFSKSNHVVFVGRAGFTLLREYDNVLNVLIKAPFDARVRKTMGTMRMTDFDEVAALVRKQDKARSMYLKTFYDASQNDAAAFDLVIDTSRIPPATATKWIVEAAKLLDEKKIDPEKSTESIESDVVLQRTIHNVLHGE